MTITTITSTEMYNRYIAAEIAVLDGKEFLLNGKKVVYEDLPRIREGRLEWERKMQTEKRQSSGKSRFAVADFTNLT